MSSTISNVSSPSHLSIALAPSPSPSVSSLPSLASDPLGAFELLLPPVPQLHPTPSHEALRQAAMESIGLRYRAPTPFPSLSPQQAPRSVSPPGVIDLTGPTPPRTPANAPASPPPPSSPRYRPVFYDVRSGERLETFSNWDGDTTEDEEEAKDRVPPLRERVPSHPRSPRAESKPRTPSPPPALTPPWSVSPTVASFQVWSGPDSVPSAAPSPPPSPPFNPGPPQEEEDENHAPARFVKKPYTRLPPGCYNCGQRDHKQARCPLPRRPQRARRSHTPPRRDPSQHAWEMERRFLAERSREADAAATITREQAFYWRRRLHAHTDAGPPERPWFQWTTPPDGFNMAVDNISALPPQPNLRAAPYLNHNGWYARDARWF
jgi:hypothetical protein